MEQQASCLPEQSSPSYEGILHIAELGDPSQPGHCKRLILQTERTRIIDAVPCTGRKSTMPSMPSCGHNWLGAPQALVCRSSMGALTYLHAANVPKCQAGAAQMPLGAPVGAVYRAPMCASAAQQTAEPPAYHLQQGHHTSHLHHQHHQPQPQPQPRHQPQSPQVPSQPQPQRQPQPPQQQTVGPVPSPPWSPPYDTTCRRRSYSSGSAAATAPCPSSPFHHPPQQPAPATQPGPHVAAPSQHLRASWTCGAPDMRPAVSTAGPVSYSHGWDVEPAAAGVATGVAPGLLAATSAAGTTAAETAAGGLTARLHALRPVPINVPPPSPPYAAAAQPTPAPTLPSLPSPAPRTSPACTDAAAATPSLTSARASPYPPARKKISKKGLHNYAVRVYHSWTFGEEEAAELGPGSPAADGGGGGGNGSDVPMRQSAQSSDGCTPAVSPTRPAEPLSPVFAATSPTQPPAGAISASTRRAGGAGAGGSLPTISLTTTPGTVVTAAPDMVPLPPPPPPPPPPPRGQSAETSCALAAVPPVPLGHQALGPTSAISPVSLAGAATSPGGLDLRSYGSYWLPASASLGTSAAADAACSSPVRAASAASASAASAAFPADLASATAGVAAVAVRSAPVTPQKLPPPEAAVTAPATVMPYGIGQPAAAAAGGGGGGSSWLSAICPLTWQLPAQTVTMTSDAAAIGRFSRPPVTTGAVVTKAGYDAPPAPPPPPPPQQHLCGGSCGGGGGLMASSGVGRGSAGTFTTWTEPYGRTAAAAAAAALPQRRLDQQQPRQQQQPYRHHSLPGLQPPEASR
ncbi:hypothetical protein PLESTB_001797500 [Pleodorina starrii]|uniref:Uncharacterized protein n=1 Tax=Pleodorina starrii TaxID=330485 RepID=A0A9W6F9Y0_9CHLO|nr:hypothetical protein PLESTM_001161900 [Pleodorina starrii]GLC61738.1 hypothetical protein PLESTB_001797500 [Pleodorina starrii]GLC69218.1 hypothetical protein PLESTF_000803200 [Pleodorina starrii]